MKQNIFITNATNGKCQNLIPLFNNETIKSLSENNQGAFNVKWEEIFYGYLRRSIVFGIL